MKTVLVANRGKMTIVAHCGMINLPDTRELLAHARSCGADGGGIFTPFYYRYSRDEFYEYYATLAQEFSDFPLYLYTIPGLAGNELSVTTVSRLQMVFPNIVGIKDSSGNFTTISGHLLALPRTFRLIVGCDRVILPTLVLRGAGTVTGPGGVVPEPFVNLWKAWKGGDYREATRFQKEVTTISMILREGGHLPLSRWVLLCRDSVMALCTHPFDLFLGQKPLCFGRILQRYSRNSGIFFELRGQ
ncbi:MAG: dihydrodipicolinate synthase family protein [Atribacterota bacterium]|nr:dihydrodipicolinate synthase family protein [Atribacterota bacterium]